MEKDFGRDKVKKICEVIKKETLDPAKAEAKEIISQAEAKAKQIIDAAKKEEERLLLEAKRAIESEHNVFKASIQLACKQSLSSLKQQIERKLLNEQLYDLITEKTSQRDIIADLIKVIVTAIEKEGLATEFSVVIPKNVDPEEIAKLLAEKTFERLKKQNIVLGEIHGGVQLKLTGKYLTIDISDSAIQEMVANFVREDFREIIFSS